MAKGTSLALSTEVAPATLFKVDGVEYKLLGIDHLSAEDEAQAMALFARHGLLAQEIELTSNTARGSELAIKLKACRTRILCKLTTLPKEIVEKLPVGAQVKLLEAIQEELAGEVDEDEDGDAKVSPPPTTDARPSILDEDDL